MKKIVCKYIVLSTAAVLLAGCHNQNTSSRPVFVPSAGSMNNTPVPLSITPNAIAGVPKNLNSSVSGGYAPTNVQAQLKIDVKEGTKEVKVIRDNTDPFVITKPYVLKYADPYAVRSYLEAAVGARSVASSPAQATAVKYADGTGVVLVAAEAYRFQDSEDGKGIDKIVKALDRPNLSFLPEADIHIYFPRISRAFTLKSMLEKVGSSATDSQFAVLPGSIMVDAELNALIVKAPKWNFLDMLAMLRKYDRPIPEVKVSYRVIEIYAENDDRIGIDFQSWKNNDGVDLFSTGTIARRNWGSFFTSGIQPTGSNDTYFWNFNPKWNTRYLDFLTSIGKAKCLAQGVIVAQNRKPSSIQVNSGFFYDRTSYIAGAKSIAEGTTEFAYTDVNPDTIQREAVTKIMPGEILNKFYSGLDSSERYFYYFTPAGYTLRMMGTQTTTNTYKDASAVAYKTAYDKAYNTIYQTVLTQNLQEVAAGKMSPESAVTAAKAAADAQVNTILARQGIGQPGSPLSQFLTGTVNADGSMTTGTYTNVDWTSHDSAPGIIHGGLQYPMVKDGFKFELSVLPVVTGKAAKIRFDLASISLLGWNSDGSARTSKSETATTVQIGRNAKEFVIGGLRKSESVRGTTGLPFLKDLSVVGRFFSTESESIKQSQLVLIARIEPVETDTQISENLRKDVKDMVKGVNKGMSSRVGNMFFGQYGLDEDRGPRKERLERVGNIINDEYKELK
ncbi:MAG: hypothetical protein IKA79_00340 [Lentisphaeria bacterium]|nr:hypothetical protein [Lentisphaeria bacterium]